MKPQEILKELNNTYKDKYIFEITKDKKTIVGFLNSNLEKPTIICAIEPTKEEFINLKNHLDEHEKTNNP